MRLIERSEDLPPIGVANEKASIDFKREPSSNRHELAKDVAAMANGEGGTILVGAIANGEVSVRYQPMTTTVASAQQKDFEEAIRDLCRPSPSVQVEHIPKDSGIVLAVNVAPMIGAAVGVRIKKSEHQALEGLYYYPTRVGAHTKPIEPDQMHSYFDASFRRKLLLLKQAEGTEVVLVGRSRSSSWLEDARLAQVDSESNVAHLEIEFRGRPVRFDLPFDRIEAVWKGRTKWRIAIPGWISQTHWSDPKKEEEFEISAVFLEVLAPSQRDSEAKHKIEIIRFPHAESLGRELLSAYRNGAQRIRSLFSK